MSVALCFSCQPFWTIRMKAGIHDIFLVFSFQRYKVVIVKTYCYFRDALPKSWQCFSIAVYRQYWPKYIANISPVLTEDSLEVGNPCHTTRRHIRRSESWYCHNLRASNLTHMLIKQSLWNRAYMTDVSAETSRTLSGVNAPINLVLSSEYPTRRLLIELCPLLHGLTVLFSFLRCSSNEYCILLTISYVINIYLTVNVAYSFERGTARRRADDVVAAATGNTVCSVILSPTGKRGGW
jgi:hypothetical protein